ncbi:acyl carrier protein [Xylanibacillus composti]|uniref:Acyl carrier protein n=1 Tax=Xylanibacillus composti TaxID=1572762 RepID=A0A8J4M1Q5_9BACL|nr:acyl carrier protein [Xylanibacillus composti]GIQ68869.1 hypothetical protein XYCOK13_16930 [Xylanibacillus composti]
MEQPDLRQELKEIVSSSCFFSGMQEEWGSSEPLVLDSMSLIILIDALEERFAISIDYRHVDLRHFESLERMEHFIRAKLDESHIVREGR